MPASPTSLIIGYGVVLDDDGRVLLLRRRAQESLWPGAWWLPGDVTPLDEEPDDTVPRLFEHLLRQRVRAGYAHTVTGEEPSSGRHTVHNAYVVTVEGALDGAPANETNPFEAMEWWQRTAALAELPQPQSELLAAVLERLDAGWDFESPPTLDELFADVGAEAPAATPATLPERSHAERRADGRATLVELTGEPGLAEDAEEALGPLGTTWVDHIWGDLWQDERLSLRDRSLTVLAVAGALRQVEGTAAQVVAMADNDLSREEIVEVCLQLTVECGFNFGVEALMHVLEAWDDLGEPYQPSPADGKGDAQRRADAERAAAALGADPDQLRRDYGPFARVMLEWAMGDVLSRPQLAMRDRSLVSVVVAVAVGQPSDLPRRLQSAMRLGWSSQELHGAIAIASAFCGVPRGAEAAAVLQRLNAAQEHGST